jgi:hypothetical protein
MQPEPSMIRSAMLILLLAGCASSTVPRPGMPPRAGVQAAPQDEVHRGLQNNQKSSPDAPSTGSADGRGGI